MDENEIDNLGVQRPLPPPLSAVEDAEPKVQALDAARRFAAERTPEEAAKTYARAQEGGIAFEAAEAAPPRRPEGASWGRLVKDHPVLAEALAEPGFASVAQDDVPQLEGFERLFAGWTDAVDTQRVERDAARMYELAYIGNAERDGRATEKMIKRREQLEAEQAAQPKKRQGLISEMAGGVLDQIPMLGRASNKAAVGLVGGAAVGSVVPGLGTVAGGVGGAGIGFTVGMTADTAFIERGLSFNEYVRLGADKQAAGVAADLVGSFNGLAEIIPAHKIFNLIPPLESMIKKYGARDFMRRVFKNNTARMAFVRWAGRVGEAGLIEGFTEGVQEWNTILGAIGSGAADSLEEMNAFDRVLQATRGGALVGVGFGGLPGTMKFAGDMAEVEQAKHRTALYMTLGQLAQDSKLRERMPAAFKLYANSILNEYGKVDEAKVPAEKLRNVFQKEGIDFRDVEKTMPEVARQLETAGPADEITIPMGDLATHIAPLESFKELHADLRIAEEPTPREAEEVTKQVEAEIAEKPKPEGEEAAPKEKGPRAVYDDMLAQLTAAGRAPEVAQHEALMWASFMQARAIRTGVDAFDYYLRRRPRVGTEFEGGEGFTSLNQRTVKIEPMQFTNEVSIPGPSANDYVYHLISREDFGRMVEAGRLDAGTRVSPYSKTFDLARRHGNGNDVLVRILDANQLTDEAAGTLNDTVQLNQFVEVLTPGIDDPAHPGQKLGTWKKIDEVAPEAPSGERTPKWQSAVEKAAATAKQEKGDAKSWKSVLSKGTKKEEMQLLGINEWLDRLAAEAGKPFNEMPNGLLFTIFPEDEAVAKSQSAEKFKGIITKQAILDYIAKNRIVIKERILEQEPVKQNPNPPGQGLPDDEREQHETTLTDAYVGFSQRQDGSYRFSYTYTETESNESSDLEEILDSDANYAGNWTRRERDQMRDAYSSARGMYENPEEYAEDYLTEEEDRRREEWADEHDGDEAGYVEMTSDEREQLARDYVSDLIEQYAKEIERISNGEIHAGVDSDGEIQISGYAYQEEERTETDPDGIENAIRDREGSRTAEEAREAMDALIDAYGSGYSRQPASRDSTEYKSHTLKNDHGSTIFEPGTYKELLFYAPDEMDKDEPFAWDAPHFKSSKGLLGHARIAEHIIAGKRVLMIEEVQSDRFQHARKATRKAQEEIDEAKKIIAKLQAPDAWEVRARELADQEADSRYLPTFEEYRSTVTAQGFAEPDRGEWETFQTNAKAKWEETRDYEIGKLTDRIARYKKRTGFETLATVAARLEMKKTGQGRQEWYDPLYDRKHTTRATLEAGSFEDRAQAERVAREEAAKEILEGILSNREAVIDAPFKQGFEEFAIKRLIMWAAEKGYEQIAWTTGDQQVKRWEGALAEAVGRIELAFNEDGRSGMLHAYEDVGDTEPKKSEPFKGKTDVELLIGDENARRLFQLHEEGKQPVLAGGDLRIGGEGMRLSYDVRMPKTVESFTGTKAKLTTHEKLVLSNGNPYFVIPDHRNADGIRKEVLARIRKEIAKESGKASPVQPRDFDYEARITEIDRQLAEYRLRIAEFNAMDGRDLFNTPDENADVARLSESEGFYLEKILALESEREALDERIETMAIKDVRLQNEAAEENLKKLRTIEQMITVHGYTLNEIIAGAPTGVDEARISARDVDGFENRTNVEIRDLFEAKADDVYGKVWLAEFPEAKREEVKKNGINLFQKAANEPAFRGKFTYDEARKFFAITLSGKADLSTFLHESGHAFLEFLRLDAMEGHEQSRQDIAIIEKWLGYTMDEIEERSKKAAAIRAKAEAENRPTTRAEEKEFDDLVEPLEQFARGFEAYLRAGKAPSIGLRQAFEAFKSWLGFIYRTLLSLNVDVAPEVAAVMDRMLASDQEITQALADSQMAPMPPPPGMSVADHQAYLDKYAKGLAESKRLLEDDALKQVAKTIGAERAAVKLEVIKSTEADKVWNAYEALRTGRRLDGAPVDPEVAGKKLSAAIVKEYELGKKWIKFARITDKDGIDPDTAAPFYGFTTGDEMIEKLAAMTSRSKFVAEETNRRMAEKYPEADIAKMAEQAVKALHNDAVENVLWLESRAMDKATGRQTPRTARHVLKGVAQRRLGQMTALEMQPGKFKRAEQRDAREWIDAVKKKDFEAARAAKESQILNFLMWQETQKGKERIDEIMEYVASFDDISTRRRVGRAGSTYLDGIDALRAGIEWRRQTNRTIERRGSLESFLKAMEDEGAVITIPAEVRAEAALKNYKQMTLDELETIYAAIKNIESMARLKNRIFDGRKQRAFQQTAAKFAEHIRANVGVNFPESDKQNPEVLDKIKTWFRKGHAERMKIEFLMREMDGGETAGFAHELGFQPFATAEEKKNALYRKVIGELLAPMKKLSLKERLRYDKTVDFLGTKIRLRDVLSIALNMGNEGNRRKLIEGYAYRGWTDEKVRQRLGELLNDKDLDLVEHIWAKVGSLWPEIEGLMQRTVGLAPPKVQAMPFEINGRTLTGGYYPIVYDRERSHKGEQIAQKKTGDLFENNFMLPAVSKGFTEARTKFFAPLQLSLNVVPSHLNEVIHYLTHYEAVRAVDRLFSHRLVREAITEGFGREVYLQLRPWLQAIAADGVVHEGTTVYDGIFGWLRVGTTINALGGKVTTAMMQLLGLTSTIKEIGPKWTAVGFARFLKEIEFSRDPFRDVNEKSAQVRDFEHQMSRELLNEFTSSMSIYADLGMMKDRLVHFSLSMIGLMQKTVNAITWYGAEARATAEGHERPSEYADSKVRLSQMGEGIKDKAAIQRGGETTRSFTVMYSYFSVLYNQLSERSGRRGIYKVGDYAARWWWLVLFPVAVEGILRNKIDLDDDPEEIAKKFGIEVALYASRTRPMMNLVFESVLSEYEPRYAPWMNTMVRALKAAGKQATTDAPMTEAEMKALYEALGVAAHVPAGAVRNAYLYLDAYQSGTLEEPIEALLFQTPAQWKKE